MPPETLEHAEPIAAERNTPAPSGVSLVGVPYELFRELRDIEENNHTRMTYLDGTLIFMSPEYVHEWGAEHLGLIVRMVAIASGQPLMGSRSTTLREPDPDPLKGSGKEPDNAFYLGPNARRIKGKDTIDLRIDPPPDLAIEVDNKSDSEFALPLYARLGVPEVWRYEVRERNLWFGRLAGGAYETEDRSLCMPRLTPGLILEALNAYGDNDWSETEWLAWLLDWARGLPGPPAP